jgi:hypothetical protein
VRRCTFLLLRDTVPAEGEASPEDYGGVKAEAKQQLGLPMTTQ